MNYLKKELDEAFRSLKISSIEFQIDETTALINNLTKKFFKSESNFLDPVELNEKNSEYNPNFWKDIQYCIKKRPDFFGI
jgi:hypothetical protein